VLLSGSKAVSFIQCLSGIRLTHAKVAWAGYWMATKKLQNKRNLFKRLFLFYFVIQRD